jgi:hypothetical protein
MTVRINFFQNDSTDFEFNVEGLKPFDKSDKKKKTA